MTSRELFSEDLKAALLAASKAYDRRRFVIVGSAAIIAWFPEAPGYLRVSADVDMFPIRQLKVETFKPGDEMVGQFSPFQEEHDFYVERVGDWTVMTQPEGWLGRCARFAVEDVEGYSLSPLDLAYNKTEAGRDKDISFVAGVIAEGLIAWEDYEAFLTEGCPHEELWPSLQANMKKVQEKLLG